ncbi:MAG: PH domain-containing protein [Microgenomates group bacterium]
MKDNKESKSQVFHSYCLYPKVDFPSREDGEEVVLILRAHPITQIFWVLNGFILFITLLILNFFFPKLFNFYQIFFLNLFFLGIILSYCWFNFLNWFFNVGIITNKKIVDIDFYGVIYKEVTMAKLNKVEDITSKTGGYIQSLFNFGNVFVQTAGTEVNIEFINIPQPSKVVALINDLLGKKHYGADN